MYTAGDVINISENYCNACLSYANLVESYDKNPDFFDINKYIAMNQLENSLLFFDRLPDNPLLEDVCSEVNIGSFKYFLKAAQKDCEYFDKFLSEKVIVNFLEYLVGLEKKEHKKKNIKAIMNFLKPAFADGPADNVDNR